MGARTLAVAIILMFVVFGVTVHLTAQKAAPQTAQTSGAIDIAANLQGVQAQLTALAADTASANKQITAKLDQIASTQQKILDELAIVKVRATRR